MPQAEGEERQRRIDYLIDQLFDVLPAATYVEIAEKLTRRTRTTVSTAMVGIVLGHLRANSDEYGWTVPHVKRGVNVNLGKRFFAALVERDGTYTLDETPETAGFMQEGAASTVSHAVTMLRNEQAALMICGGLTRSRNRRDALQDWAEDMAYLVRKGSRLLTVIRNGSTG